MTVTKAHRIAKDLWAIGLGIVIGGTTAAFDWPSWLNLLVAVIVFVVAAILEIVRCDDQEAGRDG